LDAGTHGIALPYRGAGIYLYKVKSGARELVLKGNSVGKVSSGSAVSSQGPSSNPPAKQAMSAAARAQTIDVIAVTKTGYLNYRVAVNNVDTSGITIKMIAGAGTVTDADGNVYQTVKIGNQEWMAENLRVTKYNDGTPIPLDTSSSGWWNATTPKYCYYNNTTNAASIKKYGALYNGYVVGPANPKKIAPAGWHVPTNAEWDILQNYLIANGYNWDGTKSGNKTGKSLTAMADWYMDTIQGQIGCDLKKNDKCGFAALPGGQRDVNSAFGGIGSFGYWWTATGDATTANYRCLFYLYSTLDNNTKEQSAGISVRLVKG
jgi:uncharacterized protein (TIGR02145 family)